ncbi:MAG: basic membrane protein A [Fusobacteria bacterium]|nr:MAG: basic membrane protein A [Fusobacteriota bacterium]KAF0230046.1 MAG: basic membrane protein [Fusobacteriota bacterium]
MKKILLVLAVLLFGILAVGCGEKEADKGQEVKVALALTGAINDGGWSQGAYEALKLTEKDYDAEIAYNENTQAAQYLQVIRNYAKDGYNVIIANGAQFTDAVNEVAKEYPDAKFLITSSDRNSNFGNGSNVAGVLADGVEQGFLQGVTAGLLAKSLGINKVAGVAGAEIPAFKTIMEGYVLGAKYIMPNIEVVTAFTGTNDDVNKLKEQALTFIDQGAGIVMSYANQASRGGYEAALQKGKLAIGASASPELFAAYEKSLSASASAKLTIAIADVVGKIAKGDFEGTNYIYGVKEGVVTFVFNDKEPQVQKVKADIEKIIADIKSGKIDVTDLYKKSK